MSFRSPVVLALAVLLVPLALALFAHAARRRREALALFLGPRGAAEAAVLAPIARHRRLRATLSVAALACVGVALAGPRIGTTVREARQESLDLIIALDVSESMRTEDVAPNRLARARLEIERVVDARRGDRVGLVVFAGEAFLQCPLTTDLSAVRLFLDAVDPEQIAIQGTDVGRALAVAEQAFDAAEDGGGAARPRAVLVVSDGEDHEGSLGQAADALREDGVALFALGVGTDEGGPVPEVRRGERTGVKRDRSGEPVVSRYEEEALRAVAGRGETFRIGRAGAAAPQIIDALARLDRAVLTQDEVPAGAERYQWPLALGLLLLVAERLLAARPPTPVPDPA
jgi:Ca-activated chloride channel family protein